MPAEPERAACPTSDGPAVGMATEVGASGSESEPPGDEHALNLRRALADLQNLGVPVEPADGGLVHEAVAAVHLGRTAGVLHGGVAGGQLGDGRVTFEVAAL